MPLQTPSPATSPEQLVQLFFADCQAVGSFSEVAAEEMPEWDAILLDHDQHMTLTLEAFHRSRVSVEVLARAKSEESYAREILLRRRSDDAVVQFGVVCLLRSALDADVREEIEAEETPLGSILIRRNLLRQVRLGKLWRVTPGPELLRWFETDSPAFGRTATIELERRPAIELLEIVTRTK